MTARSAALLAAGLVLGGCSWLSSTVAPASCPVVSKIGDAAKLIRFAPGSSQDLRDPLLQIRNTLNPSHSILGASSIIFIIYGQPTEGR